MSLSPAPIAHARTGVESIVQAEDVTKEFGPDEGVFDLDLEVERGTILGLIGPSGSGKTTTVRLMSGLLTPDSGRVRVNGKDPVGFDRSDKARIGYMPQHAALYPGLTLRQNLEFASSLFGMKVRRRQLKQLIDFVELEGAIDRLPAKSSGGEKRRVSLASTLIHDPDLIFLDEPTAGIDPVLRRKFWDHFETLAADSKTLVVTTQYVGEAAYCDMVGVLANGRIVALETPDGLKRLAYGGEMLLLTFERPPDITDVEQRLGRTGLATSFDWLGPAELRIVVDDASAATPQLTRWADENGFHIEKLEPFSPPFDDVFVDLIGKVESSDSDSKSSEEQS